MTKFAVPTDLVTFTEEIINGKFHFFAQLYNYQLQEIKKLNRMHTENSSVEILTQCTKNPQFPADLVTFTEKSLMENFIFCAVITVSLCFYDRKKVPLVEIYHKKRHVNTHF